MRINKVRDPHHRQSRELFQDLYIAIPHRPTSHFIHQDDAGTPHFCRLYPMYCQQCMVNDTQPVFSHDHHLSAHLFGDFQQPVTLPKWR